MAASSSGARGPSGLLLSVPNLLTLSRLPLAALVWVAPRQPLWMVTLMALAAATDMLDGYAARALRVRRRRRDPAADGEEERLGAWLDPLCDKAFVLSLLSSLWVVLGAPLSTLLLIGIRELLVLPGVLLYGLLPRGGLRFDFRAGALGKAATVTQFVSVGVLLFDPTDARGAALVTAVVGVMAGGSYLKRGAELYRRRGYDGVPAPREIR